MDSSRHKISLVNWLAVAILVGLLYPVSGSAQTSQGDYAMAMEFYSRGEYPASVSAFSSVIRNYPGSRQSILSRFYLGEALTEVGDHDGAFAAFQGFLTTAKNHRLTPRATFRMGEMAYHLKRDDQAIRLLEEFALRYPDNDLNEIGLSYLAQLRAKRNETALAIRVFKASLAAYPNGILATECRYGLAKAQQQLGDVENATFNFQQLLRSSNEDIQVNSHLALGQIAFVSQDFQSARARMQEALEIASNTENSKIELAKIYYWLGRSYLEQQEYGSALEQFQMAFGHEVRDDKTASDLCRDAAFCAEKMGDLELANKFWSRAENSSSSDEILADSLAARIDIAYEQNWVTEGLELADRFVRRFRSDPRFSRVAETRGRFLYQTGKYMEATRAFELLLQDFSEEVSARRLDTWKYLLAISQVGEGDLENAVHTLESIDIETTVEELASKVVLAKATTYQAVENFNEAIDSFQAFLAYPDSEADAGEIHQTICQLYSQLNRWNDTQKAFAEFGAIHPEAEQLIPTAQSLAARAFQQREFEHAAIWYEFLAETASDEKIIAESLAGLGWCHLKTGQEDEAQNQFGKLLNRFPDSKFALDAAIARAKYLDETGKYNAAERVYALILDRYPDSEFTETALLRRAIMLTRSDSHQNLRLARELLTDYIQQSENPTRLDEALYQMGLVYQALGDNRKSIEKFRQISLRYRGSRYWADATFRVAYFHSERNELDVAEKLTEELLKSNVADGLYLRSVMLYGDVTTRNSRWQNLLTTMNDALPNISKQTVIEFQVRYWIAEAYFQLENYAVAAERFLELHESGTPGNNLKPWALLRNAQSDFKLKNYAATISHAKRGLELYKDFEARFEFEFVRGIALVKLAKMEEAKTAFRAVADDPFARKIELGAIAQWRIGELLFHQERYAEAIKAFERVVTSFDSPTWNAAALIQAGKCQEKLGNWRQAEQLYRELVNRYPNSRFREDAQSRLVFVSRSAELHANLNKQTK